jgi:hypothetical protein
LELASTDLEMIQDIAYVLLTTYTGMRLKNVYDLFSKDVTFVNYEPTTSNPRHYRMICNTNKNDRSGVGPIENREFLLPCICLQSINGKEKTNFIRNLISNPLCVCVRPCPFRSVRSYINLCPDPTGAGRVLARQNEPTLLDLKFMRTKHLLGNEPKFLQTPMGESTMRRIPERVNSYLPEKYRQEKLTGHSGRKSLITHAIDANVSDTVLAKVN